MKHTNEQINKMAAEVLGIEWCPGSWRTPDAVQLCEHFTGTADEYERLHPKFCNDLNAAQRLVKEVISKFPNEDMAEWDFGTDMQALIDPDLKLGTVPLLPAKTITLAALVAAGKISIEDAKESL